MQMEPEHLATNADATPITADVVQPQGKAGSPDRAPGASSRPDGGWWRWLRGAMHHEPTHALTIAYLAVSFLGVWASFWFFRGFGIPILDYMDPSDYLTAGLRDPAYLLLLLGAWAFTLLLTWRDRFHQRDAEAYAAFRARHRWLRWWMQEDPERFTRWMRRRLGWGGLTPAGAVVFGVAYVTLLLTMMYVQNKASDIKAGGGHPVRLTLAHTHAPQPGNARMLGTVGEFVFLYWPQARRAEAVSVENVARLESLPRARRAAHDPAPAPAPALVPSASPPPATPAKH